MTSIKTKLVLSISVFTILLFVLTAFLFVREKSSEFTHDVYENTRTFAELASQKIVDSYNLYVPQGSFVYFNRDVNELKKKFADLYDLKILDYNGNVYYEYLKEQEKQFVGAKRVVKNEALLQEIKSKLPSVFTLGSNRLIYLKKDSKGVIQFVDYNQNPVATLENADKIAYLVYPVDDKFSVLYLISYENLNKRINDTYLRAALLASFGVALGILLALLFAGTITDPIKKLKEGAEVIAGGNFKFKVEVNTRDELFNLAEAFNTMASKLDVSTKALVYKERVKQELELAAKIQKELLPKVVPKVSGMDIAAGLIPAEEIGGDCYDFIKQDENRMLMYLGDVTGHGVPSGIVVSIANALIYSYASGDDIKNILVNVNKILKQKTISNMFMTLVMLHYDALNNKLKYVSAGHEQMIHFHAKDKTATLTQAGGLALGMFPDITKHLNEFNLEMEKGDLLVVYSDGIPECWRNEKQMFGIENFKKSVITRSGLSTAGEIRDAILKDVKDFSEGYKQMDDITLIVLKKE